MNVQISIIIAFLTISHNKCLFVMKIGMNVKMAATLQFVENVGLIIHQAKSNITYYNNII